MAAENNQYTAMRLGLLDVLDALGGRAGLTEYRPGVPICVPPGATVEWIEPTPTPTPRACRGCGATLRTAAGACAYCGGLP